MLSMKYEMYFISYEKYVLNHFLFSQLKKFLIFEGSQEDKMNEGYDKILSLAQKRKALVQGGSLIESVGNT